MRMALGAQPRDVLWLVVRQGLWLAMIGGVAGAAGALALGRTLSSLLYGVSAGDATGVRVAIGARGRHRAGGVPAAGAPRRGARSAAGAAGGLEFRVQGSEFTVQPTGTLSLKARVQPSTPSLAQYTSRSCAETTLPSYTDRTSFSSSSSVELQISW